MPKHRVNKIVSEVCNIENMYAWFQYSEKPCDLLPHVVLSPQNTSIHPQEAKQLQIIFFSTSRRQSGKKQALQRKKTKGTDSYAIIPAKFTIETIAIPAVLDTCIAGTMEHDKHALMIYCSFRADTLT